MKKLDKSRDDVVITVKFGQLRRPKGIYTREKNKVFLKFFSEQKGKIWVIKVSPKLMFIFIFLVVSVLIKFGLKHEHRGSGCYHSYYAVMLEIS